MAQLATLSGTELKEVQGLVEKLGEFDRRAKSQESFLHFVHKMWPQFIEGEHHKIMADAFDRVANGTLKRLIINMPPRHTKSEFASHMLPAWFLGRYPDNYVIQASNTAELATGFGRKVRDLVSSKEYQDVFPGISLKKDTKSAGRWSTNRKGEYFAIGLGGTMTGRGGDLVIIDDPHSESEGASNDSKVFNRAYEWYTSGPRQRLQPDAAIVIVMTRWHKGDLTGKVIKKSIEEEDADQWEVIEFPAILESGKALWPGYWRLGELLKLKGELPVQKWQAQYMQAPGAEGSSLVKRDWWKPWKGDRPPKCDFVIQSWDTAYLKTDTADPSACTEWGVFYMEGPGGRAEANIILLDAYKERLEFPALKEAAYQRYVRKQPDVVIIEAKAAGIPLVQELRKRGVPVQEFTPTRGNDKIARVNAITDLFSSGIIWYPEGKNFAQQVIEEFADFPVGEHDDLVDSGTQALIRFRQGGFIQLASDYDDEDEYVEPIRAAYY